MNAAATATATNRTALQRAVLCENSHAATTEPLYKEAASDLSALFQRGDASGVHRYLCDAQDLARTGPIWNKQVSGTKRALASLPDPLLMTATRGFNPDRRTSNPLFELRRKADVDAEKQAAEAEAARRAAELDKQFAEEAAAAQAALDRETTAADLIADLLSEAERVGIDRIDLVLALQEATSVPVNEAAELRAN
jgi:hypothetical protein